MYEDDGKGYESDDFELGDDILSGNGRVIVHPNLIATFDVCFLTSNWD